MKNTFSVAILVGALWLAGNSQAQVPSALPAAGTPSVASPTLRRELLRLVDQDQAIRQEYTAKGVQHPDPSVMARMAAIDNADTARVRAIVRRYGWPGAALVGRDGSDAAFLLVQHADTATQKQMLPLVERAYKKGDLTGQDYALLLDRVLVSGGKPQEYGTQARRFSEWKGHEPALMPIRDEAGVDERRAAVGLFPLSLYKQLLKQAYFPQDKAGAPPMPGVTLVTPATGSAKTP